MAPCKDQEDGLVEKLTAFLRGLSGVEIDSLVMEARKKINAETLEYRKDILVKLFRSQIQKLEVSGCPKTILEIFQNKEGEVVLKASKMNSSEGNIPFLPVIPRSYMGIYALMSMVKNGDKVGYTRLDPNELTDVVETPKIPYYAFDVEKGEAILGKSPEDAEKIIKSQERLCLTTDEIIAIGFHTAVLSDYHVNAIGSRCKSDNVPILYLHEGKPELSWHSFCGSDDKWGSASCGSRV